MTVVYLEALAAIAVSLAVLMAGAWVVQQRTGNSGWVDTIWTFSLGLVGAGSALWPVAGAAPNARQWLVAALVAIWSLRLGMHIAIRTAGISDDPRYAAFAKEWGADSPRRMFIFLQNQALGSIPLAFAIFVAARFPADVLRPQDYLGALILLAGNCRRGAGRRAAQAFPRRSRQQGPGLRCRAVALVAASELFLRMVRLARLSRDRALVATRYLSLGMGNAAGAGLHVLDPGLRHRHPAAGRADAALARRSLPRLPVAHQSVLSAAAASMIPRSGDHFSKEIMLRNEGSGHMSFVSTIIGTAERVPLPDAIIRAAIHRLCSRTATRLASGNAESDAWLRRRNGGARDRRIHRRGQRPALRGAGGVLRPCARARTANIPRCFYKEPASTLQEAEEEALRQTVEHADLADGQSILELGCGWGSLSLWMARQFPHAQITAVSNSNSQREYIEGEAAKRGLTNLRVITLGHERVRRRSSSSIASSRSRCSST